MNIIVQMYALQYDRIYFICKAIHSLMLYANEVLNENFYVDVITIYHTFYLYCNILYRRRVCVKNHFKKISQFDIL